MISTDSLDFYYESLAVNGLLKSRFSWFFTTSMTVNWQLGKRFLRRIVPFPAPLLLENPTDVRRKPVVPMVMSSLGGKIQTGMLFWSQRSFRHKDMILSLSKISLVGK